MNKILIVEDEVKLRQELKTFLEANGYSVQCLTDFLNPVKDILDFKGNLLLLDINLPNVDGEYICKEVRKESNLPIIMVTSRNNEIDELISINYGADDFITKPYNLQILLARINRILSRNNEDNKLEYKDIVVDVLKSQLEFKDQVVELTKNEIKIISYLLKNIGKIVSRDELMNYLWDNNEYVDDNTLTVNINRLRSKLETIGFKDVILTKRGQGYIIL